MSPLRWLLGASLLAGLACQQIVGITDRKVGTTQGTGGVDGGHAIDVGIPMDMDAPAADVPGLGRDAVVGSGGTAGNVTDGGGMAGTGGIPSSGGAGAMASGGVIGLGGTGVGGTAGAKLDASVVGAGGSATGGTVATTGGSAGSRLDAGLGGTTGTGGLAGTGGWLATGGTTVGTGGLIGSGGVTTGGVTSTGGVGTGGVTGTGGIGTGGTIANVCNDGVKSATEQCDGADLGGKTCASIGLGAGGTLGCAASCTLDTSGCRPTLVLFGGRYSGTNSSVLGDTWEYANGAWRELSPPTSPGGRWGACLGSHDGTVVLFGGYGYQTPTDTGLGYRSDTWVWDGTNWTKKAPAHAPSARYSAAMGTFRGKVILFGGWSGSMRFDTWEWDGNDWTERTPVHSPPPADAKAAANIGGERLMLFGAGTETWEWDGNDWLQSTPATAPEDRKYLRAASMNGTAILFGGSSNNTSSAIFYDDTWRWDGSNWTRLLTGGPPPARRNFAIAPLGTGVLMVGGYGSDGSILDDVWEWTGATWAARATGPAPRHDVYMAVR